MIGEFDGKGKYLKGPAGQSSDPGEAVYQDNLREDELRAQGSNVVRWGWSESGSPDALGRMLRAAGVRVVRKPSLPLGSW